MKKAKEFDISREFDFSRARRVTPEEVEAGRQAIKALTGKLPRKRPGPAPTPAAEKYQPIAIRLHPKVMQWARREAKKRDVGYQTVINDALLEKVA